MLLAIFAKKNRQMDYAIVISGTIGSWWNGCSADFVRYTLNKNKGKDVHVGFCSLGGYVKDGLEMYQAFKDHGRVHAHAFGMNASISTIAMLGCNTIDIVKGSFFLIHNVSTFINKYEQANKEQLDDMIKKLQSERAELKTFDDVLAQMYADKTGKSTDECLAQMKKGNWLTAQQAVDFGLVDSIREDKAAEDAAAEFSNQFINSYTYSNQFEDAGIPPLQTEDDSKKLAAVIDGEGNPTQSFLQKTWQGLQSLFHNPHADNSYTKMIKIFNAVASLLDAKDGFETQTDGCISLTQDQMKKINDRLEELERTNNENGKAMKASADALKKLKDDLKKAQDESKEKDDQIAALKGGAGDNTDEKPMQGEDSVTAQDLYNMIADV